MAASAPPSTATSADPGSRKQRSLPHLDGLRAIAVLFIFVRHAWGLSEQPNLRVALPGHVINASVYVVMMSSAVDLFFVLSGFLLARQWLVADYTGKPRPSLGRYARTRFWRIAPPYWIILLLVVALYIPEFIEPRAVWSAHGAAVMLAHATFLQAAFFPSYGSFGVESPFWTLTVEVIFYAVLPFVMVAFVRKRWLWSLPLTAAITITWLIAIRWSAGPLVGLVQHHLGGQWVGADANSVRYFLWHQFPEHLVDFACGIVAANLDVRRALRFDDAFTRRLTSRAAGIGYLIAGGLIVLLNMRLLGTYSLQNGFYDGISIIAKHNHQAVIYYFCEEMPFGIGYGLILLGLSCGPAVTRRPLSPRWLTGVGVIGYSIYLIHMPVLYRLNLDLYKGSIVSRDPFEHFLQLTIAAAVVTLLLSTLYFHGVEKPFMKRGRVRSVPVPSPDAVSSPTGARSDEPAVALSRGTQ